MVFEIELAENRQRSDEYWLELELEQRLAIAVLLERPLGCPPRIESMIVHLIELTVQRAKSMLKKLRGTFGLGLTLLLKRARRFITSSRQQHPSLEIPSDQPAQAK